MRTNAFLRFAGAALALTTLTLPLHAAAQAPYVLADNGRAFATLQAAVDAIGAGSGTIMIAPGTHADCAVQTAGTVTYRATTPGTAVLAGRACEDKAALVLRGTAATIDGIVFAHMAVHDANGAGIRLEHGDLTVTNAMFRDSEEGILTADDPAATVRISRSTFSGLGRCDRGLSCAHSIYAGHDRALIVTRTRFERGHGGHYVKSRALVTSVTESSFDDSAGHATNYMIDLSNGSDGTIAGNRMVQGRDKENYGCFIAVAAEGEEQSSAHLTIVNNDAAIVPGVTRTTHFLCDWTKGGVRLGVNRLGAGVLPVDRR